MIRQHPKQEMSINLFNPDDYSEDEDLLLEMITTNGTGLYHNKKRSRLEAWHVENNNPELVGLVFDVRLGQKMTDDMEQYWQMKLKPDYTWLH